MILRITARCVSLLCNDEKDEKSDYLSCDKTFYLIVRG